MYPVDYRDSDRGASQSGADSASNDRGSLHSHLGSFRRVNDEGLAGSAMAIPDETIG